LETFSCFAMSEIRILNLLDMESFDDAILRLLNISVYDVV
jgi:hypothetical protein